MGGGLYISIVIPVFNNAQTLDELCSRICMHLKGESFEIILVDDCSTDESLEVIDSIIDREGDKVRLKKSNSNKGQQLNTLEGLKYCHGEKIVVMDADLQDKPEYIKALLEKINGTSIVSFIKRQGIYQRWDRMISSRIFKSLLRLSSKLHHRAGSFYAMDRQVLELILDCSKNIYRPYLTVMAAILADKIKYIEKERSKPLGPSSFSFLDRLVSAFQALHCSLLCKRYKLKLSRLRGKASI